MAISQQSVISGPDGWPIPVPRDAMSTPSTQTPRFGFDVRLTVLQRPVAAGGGEGGIIFMYSARRLRQRVTGPAIVVHHNKVE